MDINKIIDVKATQRCIIVIVGKNNINKSVKHLIENVKFNP